MRTSNININANTKVIELHHAVADVKIKPIGSVSAALVKRLVFLALDHYAEREDVVASIIHDELKQRHGEAYRSPGYYLRLYRNRLDFTQKVLADQAGIMQHHLSEMEHNKRNIGIKLAKKLAKILKIDYKKFL